MCETMANMPMEDTPSYVLTEDMFDAAMTEQLTYQDDIESEEELSSLEENMDVDQDTQGSYVDNDAENAKMTTKIDRHISTESVIVNPETFTGSSVLVIETGLDKGQSNGPRKDSVIVSYQKNTDISESCADKSLDRVDMSSNKGGDKIVDRDVQPQSDSRSEAKKDAEGTKSSDIYEKSLPILKKILSDKPAHQRNVSIESINLCETDTEDSSDDEFGEIETIDDELKSVMENNLMAEVGITVNKQTSSERNREKPPQNSPPKIAVKSLAQISSNCSSTLQNNSSRDNSTQVSTGFFSHNRPTTNMQNKPSVNINSTMTATCGTSVKEKDLVQTTNAIQINKIAIPHQTFVSSQGHRMKCVYVRSPNTSIPLVINSNQPPNNKNIQYVLAPQLNKGPVQVSPLVALTNLTKQNLPSVKPVASRPTKTMTMAPKLQRPSLLQNVPPLPHQFKQDQTLDSIIKSLIFHNLKKPYVPTEVEPNSKIYACLDCKDRFLYQSSLNGHLARRSISILYWCRICKVELQFFNRCVLLKHLRGHNNSIKHIDTTCIKFSPMPTNMKDNGVIQPFVEEGNTSISVPNEVSATPRANNSGLQNIDSQTSESSILTEKPAVASTSSNSSNQKTKTISQINSGSSKAQTSVLLQKPKSTTTHLQSDAPKQLPTVLPRTGKMALYEALQKQTKDQSLLANKSPVINVSQKSKPNGIQKTTIVQKTKPLPPPTQQKVVSTNTVGKQQKTHCIEEIIDDDNIDHSNHCTEDEEIDVEKITPDINSVNKIPAISSSENQESSVTNPQQKKNLTLKRYCSECGVGCINISKHLNSWNRPTNPDLTCEVCQLILPTKCSLKIHLRIHMKVGPYKCPDCGKDFNTWDEGHAHLKFSCGHLAKCMRYMCISCKAHFPSKSGLGHHISTKHSRDIFKCPTCPVAFFNKLSLTKHLTSHPGDDNEELDYKQCSLCPKKLVQTDKFATHVEEHVNSNTVLIYGYKCPMCSVVFANKMAFIIHQIKEKSVMDSKNPLKSKKGAVTTSNILISGNQNNEDNNSHGAQASDSNSDYEDEPVIVRKFPEQNNSVPEKDPLSLEGWESAEEQRVKVKREELCIVCKKNLVVLLPGIDLNNQSLCCKQCVKPLDNIDVAVNGNIKKTKNSGRNFLTGTSSKNNSGNTLKRKRNTPSTVKRSSSCDEYRSVDKRRRPSDNSQNGASPGTSGISNSLFADISPVANENGTTYENSFGLDMELFPNKKKTRKKQNKINPADQAFIQGKVITSKSGELVCSKCDYVGETREAFLDHISVHRTDPTLFQCLECGLCFLVLPSLERHLQIHHAIKDINNYTENNKACLPQKVAPIEEDVEDNQCRVCKEMFDCSSSLEKHFRTHGMAFMNSLSKSP